MGFCKSTVKDGIFILTLGASDGAHNYLNVQFLRELEEELKDIRTNRVSPTSRGLVTTSRGKWFCEGLDYNKISKKTADELAVHMARVVHELFIMPLVTVATVTVDVRSSLGLAFVLAHDETMTMSGTKFEVKEVSDCCVCMPPYFAALLRDKVPFPRMRSSMVLRSETMDGSDLAYWEVVECRIYDKENWLATATLMITDSFGAVDGRGFVTTRKSFFPESWKAVSEFLGANQ